MQGVLGHVADQQAVQRGDRELPVAERLAEDLECGSQQRDGPELLLDDFAIGVVEPLVAAGDGVLVDDQRGQQIENVFVVAAGMTHEAEIQRRSS